MQRYMSLLANDLELIRALKLSSIDTLFSESYAGEHKSFFYTFGKSWLADSKTALEKFLTFNKEYSEIQNTYKSNDTALIIYISEAETVTINLDVFLQQYKPTQVIILVASDACFNLQWDVNASYTSIISFDIHVKQRAHMELRLKNSSKLTDILFCHIASHIDANATLKVDQYQNYGKQLYFFDYYLKQTHAAVKHLSSGTLDSAMYQGIITRQFHQAASTESDISIKTILDGDARSFYRGTIAINENGAGSVAQQQHRALMMSDTAYTCGIPSLEVSAHEVRCVHGTAASSIDEQLLWYLQSKGLSYRQAKQFLVRSFLIKNNNIDDELEKLIALAQQRLT